MKIHLAFAALAVISESIAYCRMKHAVRSPVSHILVRMAGKPLMLKALYSPSCKYYRHVIISPHDTIEL